jgi:hypothetical protein
MRASTDNLVVSGKSDAAVMARAKRMLLWPSDHWLTRVLVWPPENTIKAVESCFAPYLAHINF